MTALSKVGDVGEGRGENERTVGSERKGQPVRLGRIKEIKGRLVTRIFRFSASIPPACEKKIREKKRTSESLLLSRYNLGPLMPLLTPSSLLRLLFKERTFALTVRNGCDY